MLGHRYTKKDIAAMEAEIEHRKLVERPKLIEAVKEARAQGDLSENFEYYAAKREKNRNESRIRYLDKQIRYAIVFEEEADENQVGVGDEIVIYFPEDDLEETYTLYTTMGSDSLNNKISIESPIGKAIHGKRVGDKCQVNVSREISFPIEIRKITKNTD